MTTCRRINRFFFKQIKPNMKLFKIKLVKVYRSFCYVYISLLRTCEIFSYYLWIWVNIQREWIKNCKLFKPVDGYYYRKENNEIVINNLDTVFLLLWSHPHKVYACVRLCFEVSKFNWDRFCYRFHRSNSIIQYCDWVTGTLCVCRCACACVELGRGRCFCPSVYNVSCRVIRIAAISQGVKTQPTHPQSQHHSTRRHSHQTHSPLDE